MFTRTIRATGEKLTVGTAVELGLDPEGGKWVTVCEEHKTHVYAPTQSAAYYTHGIDFCDGCREGSPAPVAEAAPAKRAAKPAPVKKATTAGKGNH
ncbi:hypothetical protein [uncultured Microbacterium sp.]|uniref:hypothetical protein n=1 Tax=uncultured Microbacterium sp. TaxID=191216 RepID=UPI0026252726|nr:hypothetical protein [uncultured Microbacterium sp.]